ncbi:ribosome small subunit-dependent GTPase A [Marininema halotolerans]|uniref:Small ribosomal subunit biogenesis GTPase RsgA n=1 Tax=Marininema halotolerans TaxID=1155944 RepID=A0A1I6R2U8_9BACL|nr:ribosome small subunit-dependent GTPase A [Marininema halotolerans]SFS58828.1 ribosome biogenesis GTPase [Marininema halotolerans]
MNLQDWGLDPFFEEGYSTYQADRMVKGRVTLEHRHLYRVQVEGGERLASISGKLRHQAVGRDGFPAVGDWVVLREGGDGRAVIDAILPRKSKFTRREAGFHIDEQIVAANVDTVFLVMGLDQDFNLRRLERYLTVAWESGAMPVIVLTKADLCEDPDEKRMQVEQVALGVPVHVVSAFNGEGIDCMKRYLEYGRTVALTGSSGVGKSTLINRLADQELLATGEVRADGRGRHTTTHRELVLLPEGGLLLDTPGMRLLKVWENEGGVDHTFADILTWAEQCKFSDCCHEMEPGCAVQEAIDQGVLDSSRLQNYRKLGRELAYLERKKSSEAMRSEKERWKKLTIQYHKKGWHRR